MTQPKTLSNQQEAAILVAVSKLTRLDKVDDLLSANTYRAARREILRDLVKQVTAQTLIGAFVLRKG